MGMLEEPLWQQLEEPLERTLRNSYGATLDHIFGGTLFLSRKNKAKTGITAALLVRIVMKALVLSQVIASSSSWYRMLTSIDL